MPARRGSRGPTDSRASRSAQSRSPTSPNVVYAGTGEAKFLGWTYAGTGMLRSDDSGATWSAVNTTTFARASVRGILVHPADPNIVVAGTARGGAGRDSGLSDIGIHLRDSQVDRRRRDLDAPVE